MWQFNPYAPVVVLATLTTLVAAWWVWRRPAVTASREFLAVCLCISAHGLGTIWDLSAATLAGKNVGLFIVYLGFLFTPTTALRFAVTFTGRSWLWGWRWWLLNVPALVMLALFLTNRYHHLAEISSELAPRDGFVMRHAVGGPAFWAYAAFAYGLAAAVSVLYALEISHGALLLRRQARLLFAGTLAPWAANAVYLLGLAPDPALDLTPIAYGLTAALWGVALTRGGMFELVPIARNRVFDMLSDAVIVVDGKGRVLDANGAMATLIARPLSSLPGRTLEELGLQGVRDELSLDGRTFSIGRSAVTGGSASGEVLLFRDVSAQRRALDEADALARARADFLARMSHEVRTPLFGLLGATELAMDGSIDAQTRSLLEVARRSGTALSEVVDEILDFERLGSEHVRAEALDVDLLQLCGDLFTLFSLRARERGLELRAELDAPFPFVRTDGPRLRQVLSNLLSNALKFTSAGEVVLRLTTRARGPDHVHVVLVVRDTGPGIAADASARVFEPFVQADETISRRYGGTGLGLSIVRDLVQLLGGTITLDSEVGRGSSFTVQLTAPLGRSPRVVREPKRPGGREGAVLVVDDHLVGGALTRAMLEREGLQVEVARSGEETLALATPGRFALIFLDVQLPDISGPQVLQRLRQRGVETPVVWLTADVQAPPELAAGMLHKPFNREQLGVLLDRHLPVTAATIRLPAVFPEVTAAFAVSSASELAALEAAARTGDRSTIELLVHGLQGSAGLVGATEVAASCAALLDSTDVLRVLPALRRARARDLERLGAADA